MPARSHPFLVNPFLQGTVFYTHCLCPVREVLLSTPGLLLCSALPLTHPCTHPPTHRPALQYAERVWIALLEKGLPHRLVHIDLSRKPAWYRSVNPRGLVPALQLDGSVVVESADICRHVDAQAAGPSLTPQDPPLQRQMEALLRGPCSGAVSVGLDLMAGGCCGGGQGLPEAPRCRVPAEAGACLRQVAAWELNSPSPATCARRRRHGAALGHRQRADGGAAGGV